jgi:hypothetical protein
MSCPHESYLRQLDVENPRLKKLAAEGDLEMH